MVITPEMLDVINPALQNKTGGGSSAKAFEDGNKAIENAISGFNMDWLKSHWQLAAVAAVAIIILIKE